MSNAFEEFAKCKADFVYFANNYIKISHPKRGLVPFEIYDYQKNLIRTYTNHRFLIVKKFRQGGLTTLTVMWLLWKCMFEPEQKIFFACKTDREAVHVGRLIDMAIQNMPEWFKPRLTINNQHEKKFAMTDSKIWFHTIIACRSCAVTHLVIDEAAFIPDMGEKWKMIYPMVSTGGNVIALSTVNGIGNWFSETWFDAVDGKNYFCPVEIDYRDHPEFKDPEWVEQTKKNLGEIGWRQEVLGEFLVDTPELERVALEDAAKRSDLDLGNALKSIAWRFKRGRKRDIESYAVLIEAWKRFGKFSQV